MDVPQESAIDSQRVTPEVATRWISGDYIFTSKMVASVCMVDIDDCV